MSRDESSIPQSGDTGSDVDATDSKAIGARFEVRWAEEQLEAAFAASGQSPTAPRSVGVIEVGVEDGRPITALLEDLGPDLTLHIRRSLPRGARLVFAHGARFVLALPGDPLLEAFEKRVQPARKDRLAVRKALLDRVLFMMSSARLRDVLSSGILLAMLRRDGFATMLHVLKRRVQRALRWG